MGGLGTPIPNRHAIEKARLATRLARAWGFDPNADHAGGSTCALAMALVCWTPPIRAAVTARLFYGRSADTEGCPDEDGLRGVSNRVGYDPIVLWSPNGVVVTITRRGDALVADVRLLGRDGVLLGVRTLEAGRNECTALSRAIALAVGIALDMIEKSTQDAPPPAEPESGQTAPASPVAPAPPHPAEAAEVADRRPVRTTDCASARWEAGAAIADSSASCPSIRRSVPLRIAALGHVELGLEARAELAPQRLASDQLRNAGLQTWVIAGGPFVCVHRAPWFGCLLASGGAVHAEVSNVLDAQPGLAPYVALGGKTGVLLPLPAGFAFRPSLSLVGQPVDLSVYAAGTTRVWHASPVGGVAEFAIVKRFP